MTTPELLGEMTDVLGKLIVEVRESAGMVALASELGGTFAGVFGAAARADVTDQSAFVLLQRYGPISRFPRAPYYTGRILVDCYGPAAVGGPQIATRLYRAVSDALHAKGYRQSAGGVAVSASYEDLGGQALEDPDTRQPVERSIYIYSAPTAQAGA
jgi:hypothetical protein